MILIFWIGLSFIPAVIASGKGRSGAGFFFLSLLLSPLIGGICALVAAPNRQVVEKRTVVSGEMKKCPFCAELVKSEAVLCRFCGKEFVASGSAMATTERGMVLAQATPIAETPTIELSQPDVTPQQGQRSGNLLMLVGVVLGIGALAIIALQN